MADISIKEEQLESDHFFEPEINFKNEFEDFLNKDLVNDNMKKDPLDICSSSKEFRAPSWQSSDSHYLVDGIKIKSEKIENKMHIHEFFLEEIRKSKWPIVLVQKMALAIENKRFCQWNQYKHPSDVSSAVVKTGSEVYLNNEYQTKNHSVKHMNSTFLSPELSIKSGLRDFSCRFCSLAAVEDSVFQTQQQIRTVKSFRCKHFKCALCSYAATTKTHLKIHLRIHSGEKPFKCDHCDYATTVNSNCKRHLQTHSGEKPFKCEHCDYATTVNANYKRHLKIHSGEKPFKCAHCSYAATQKIHLNNHLKIHSGEKPFKCDRCDYATIKSSHLKRHLKIHSGEKPYKCYHCDYATSENSSLKRHLNIHSWEKPF